MTGFPGLIGRRLTVKILSSEPDARVLLLTQERFNEQARQALAALEPTLASRVEILNGDIVAMDLGLSGEEYDRVTREVTDIYHLAAIYYVGVAARETYRVNVDGTRNVLEMARECVNLCRFNHFSTCWVSGDRAGVVEEDELDCGQSFRNAYERSKFIGERLVVEAMADLPISIHRPSIVVGDSQTGEIDRFRGVYHLGILMVASPVAVPLPLPGAGVAPLNMVPIDFVVDASYHISLDPRAVGRTFHIVDPNPPSSRRVYELIAERSGKRVPRLRVSYSVARLLLKVPGLESVTRQSRQTLDFLNHVTIFNCPNTLEVLEGSGIMCPRFESYVGNLMSYVRRHLREQQARDVTEVEDSLDS